MFCKSYRGGGPGRQAYYPRPLQNKTSCCENMFPKDQDPSPILDFGCLRSVGGIKSTAY